MLYRTMMVLGVLALSWSGIWFYRVFTGIEHLHRADVLPMIFGGISGGLAAFYFVPWLQKRGAARRQSK